MAKGQRGLITKPPGPDFEVYEGPPTRGLSQQRRASDGFRCASVVATRVFSGKARYRDFLAAREVEALSGCRTRVCRRHIRACVPVRIVPQRAAQALSRSRIKCRNWYGCRRDPCRRGYERCRERGTTCDGARRWYRRVPLAKRQLMAAPANRVGCIDHQSRHRFRA